MSVRFKFINANGIGYEPERFLSTDDVLLYPKHSVLKSRNDPQISLATKATETIKMKIPLISANMDTVTEADMAIAMGRLGGLGILHRFYKTKEQWLTDVKKVHDNQLTVAFSIGLNPKDVDLIGEVLNITKVAIVCVDVAHGDQEQVFHQIRKISLSYPNQVQIIGGNVATPGGVNMLIDAGVHCCKINVGTGSMCSTRLVTGAGIPGLTAVFNAAKVIQARQKNVALIADGGIRNSGDIIKYLAAGADAVMIGRLFAGTNESPGEMIYKGDHFTNPHKLYRGQSSQHFLDDLGKNDVAAEGEHTYVPHQGSVIPIVNDLLGGIRSGMTYCGVKNLRELANNSTFLEITTHGWIEGTPHGLKGNDNRIAI